MSIPLLSKEDVEKDETGGENKDIRSKIIELLKSEGYNYVPADQMFVNETYDLFIKDEKSVEIIFSDDMPEGILN